jgi:ankyrin repeat protein
MKNFKNFKNYIKENINIFTAIKRKDLDAIEANKDFVNIYKTPSYNYSDNMMHDEKMTPLVYAIKNSNIVVVKKLIELGADVNEPYSYETGIEISPLYDATEKGKNSIIKELLKAGADINFINNGKTALDVACEYFNSIRSLTVSILLKANAIPSMYHLDFIFDRYFLTDSKAERKKRYKTMLLILDNNNINLNDFIDKLDEIPNETIKSEIKNEISKHKFKNSTKQIKIETNYVENSEIIKIKEKIDNGADPNDFFKNAINDENVELVKFLVDVGVNLTKIYINGYSALDLSLSNNNESFKIFKIIIDAMEINDIPNNIFYKLLEVNIKFTKYLLKKLDKTDIQRFLDNKKDILVSIAGYYLTTARIKLFLELGADMFETEKHTFSEFYKLNFLEIIDKKSKKNRKKYDEIVSWMKEHGYYKKYEMTMKRKKFNL